MKNMCSYARSFALLTDCAESAMLSVRKVAPRSSLLSNEKRRQTMLGIGFLPDLFGHRAGTLAFFAKISERHGLAPQAGWHSFAYLPWLNVMITPYNAIDFIRVLDMSIVWNHRFRNVPVKHCFYTCRMLNVCLWFSVRPCVRAFVRPSIRPSVRSSDSLSIDVVNTSEDHSGSDHSTGGWRLAIF